MNMTSPRTTQSAVGIFSGASVATMSSREIAELCDKEHKNVLADIRNMLNGLGQAAAEFSATAKINGPNGSMREIEVFNLPKRETLILVSGYNVELRARIIDRWQQLEEENSRQAVRLPNFADPAESARAWADQYERRVIAENTKAEIGSRREATAMNTASHAVKKVKKLEIELDRSMQYATVKRMSMLYHGQSFQWRMLRHVSNEMGLPAIEVFDANYGTVKAYHADVWREAYAIEIIGDMEGGK